MESEHKMLSIKDERETASVLCPRGYLSVPKAFGHPSSESAQRVQQRHIIIYRKVADR